MMHIKKSGKTESLGEINGLKKKLSGVLYFL